MKFLSSASLMSLVFVGFVSGAMAKETEKSVVGSIPTKNLTKKDYLATAKVSSGQAAKAVTDAIPGQILSIGLEKEDGFLVYAVEVMGHDSNLYEVNVDAGNGKILSKEKRNSNVSEKEESSEEKED